MNRKILMLTIIIFINSIIFVGCWNYKEIEDKIIVSGIGVDYDEKEELLILTIEAVKAVKKGSEVSFNSEIIEMRGKNFFDAIRNTLSISGKKLFFSHAKVLIFSESIVNKKEMFISVLDMAKRDAEIRDDIWVLLSKEDSAMEIWNANVKIHNIISYHLEDMMKNESNVSKFRSIKLWELLNSMSNDGIQPTIPTVEIREETHKIIPTIVGTSVFRGIEKVGWLNGPESKAFLLVIDELKGGTIVINEKISNESVPISFEIFNNKTKVKPIYKNEVLSMKIDINTSVNVNEVGASKNILTKEWIEKIKKDGEKNIEIMIEDLIRKVQREYKSDIFGFGSIIEREMPGLWKEIGSRWDQIFSELRVEIKSELEIKGTALRSKSIEVGD